MVHVVTAVVLMKHTVDILDISHVSWMLYDALMLYRFTELILMLPIFEAVI